MRNEGFSEKPARILIIDDDQKLCSLVRDYLAPHGYDVAAAFSGPAGLDAAMKGDFKAIILDVMLPGMDGFEVLQQLRREVNTPVLMLTSRGDETDRIVGLEMGADDYVPKTFSTRELLARLRAVIRRAGTGSVNRALSDQIVEVGPVRVDHLARVARLNNEPIDLTPVEFELLFQLARSPGRVLSRDQLLDRVSGRDYDVYDRSIDVHVSSLRRKLNDDPRCPKFIKTVRSIGYMFIDPEQE
ncbi:MAG TPA: response regulator transcription factor [Myxococcota bacterium]|nr:response regulator transcription factor [Myxococcota bacterium]HOA13566.1 response regulator transcription factor [Myxococcota bacterium]HOH76746.1 response regulator transcription factor [Myxococcota bacterium]